ncbi:hypothetical protein AM493_15655 [Flavobacterium akiainvivens]|uniref:Uncharacterized protein n=1 Tax=Flavobacterium akiainvivens TaxID=1202724 RepID=A0A0M9VJ40_9FLAO|nr:hypothetical protein [Flavobacterium akiainvivens]KOS07312.1 hypothetical protein AM493_15655 [Flavobacterium akiainvivens]SFQ46547.1 hypothetical protein SAMN05444144_105113 [Flavobacterium akiainvivens]
MLMALHIFNFSIDNPHTLTEFSRVDEDFEEVDSFVELVLEEVLMIDDAIPEHHSKTPISHKMFQKKATWFFGEQYDFVFEAPVAENYKIILADTFYKDTPYLSPYLALFSPPPEV